MGYYFEWGDYKGASRTIIASLDEQAKKKGWLVREEIYERIIYEKLSSNHREVKQWGSENLNGSWTMAHARFGSDRFTVLYFELEEDFIGFKLMWL